MTVSFSNRITLQVSRTHIGRVPKRREYQRYMVAWLFAVYFKYDFDIRIKHRTPVFEKIGLGGKMQTVGATLKNPIARTKVLDTSIVIGLPRGQFNSLPINYA